MAMNVCQARSRRAVLNARVSTQLIVGFRYVQSFVPIRTALVLIAATSMFGIPHSILMPVMASDVLGGGAYTLGALMAASGVGALGGALYLASRQTVVGLGRAIGFSTLAYGASLIGFAALAQPRRCRWRCCCCRVPDT